MHIKHLSLTYALIVALFASSCKTMEYAEDEVHITGNKIAVSNVGFYGYELTPPPGYKRVVAKNVPLPEGLDQGAVILATTPDNIPFSTWLQIENTRQKYLKCEGLHFHFHQDFIFQNGTHIVFFIPFQMKAVHQFLHYPVDKKERFLVDFVRHGAFARIMNWDLNMDAYSDDLERSVVILKSNEALNGKLFEEHLVTGYLNELFIVSGFTVPGKEDELSKDLGQFVQNLKIHRTKPVESNKPPN